MPAAARKKPAPENALRMFHASLVVTRVEEWCVEAESAEDARMKLAAGEGHRCTVGDRLHHEVEKIYD